MSFPEHFDTPFDQDEYFHANKSEFYHDQFYPNSLIDDGYQENQSTDETEKAIENVVFNNKNNEDIDNNNENDKISYTEEIYFQKNNNIEIEQNILVPTQDEKKESNEIIKTKDEIDIKNVNNNININNVNNNINNKKEDFSSDISKTKVNLDKKRTKNYSTEKLLKKSRIFALKAIINFVNEKIKYYFNNIGKGLLKMEFQDIEKTNLSHSNVEYDRRFLNFKLGEILSWNISSKITNFFREHNKNLVNTLLNSENCSVYFSQLFKLTFNDCLKYIQRKEQKYYDLLNGLGDCEEIIETFSKEEDTNNLDYWKKFKNVFEEYQEFIANKKERQSRKKINNKI